MNGVGKVSFCLRFFAGNPMTVRSDPSGLPLIINFGGNWILVLNAPSSSLKSDSGLDLVDGCDWLGERWVRGVWLVVGGISDVTGGCECNGGS